MGSTWEEIVNHVSQAKWENEYKVYLLDCDNSTRYVDKQANTDFPTPFHIDDDAGRAWQIDQSSSGIY